MTSRKMFYGASPNIFSNAKNLRNNMTEAELILWKNLRNNALGVRFKPQHPAGIFILDFYCHKLKLAIEVDGGIHDTKKEYDEGRESELEELGIKVIRFRNNEVIQNTKSVIIEITKTIGSITSNQFPK